MFLDSFVTRHRDNWSKPGRSISSELKVNILNCTGQDIAFEENDMGHKVQIDVAKPTLALQAA